MLRRDREITDMNEMLEVLDSCEVIRIGMFDEDGGIYVLPMNFGYTYEEGVLTFYLHAALDGKKIDLLRKCGRVGFELDCGHQLVEGKLPCQYGYRYASIIGSGEAQIVEDPKEKTEAMVVLMKCMTGKDFEFNERLVSIVSVIKITAESFCGKKRE